MDVRKVKRVVAGEVYFKGTGRWEGDYTDRESRSDVPYDHSYCKAFETFSLAARSAGTMAATTTTKSSKIGAPASSHG